MNIRTVDIAGCSVHKLSEVEAKGIGQVMLSAVMGRAFVVGENDYYLGVFSVDNCDTCNKIDNLRQIPVVISESSLSDESVVEQARRIFSSEDGWKYGILPVVNNSNKLLGGVISSANNGSADKISCLARLEYYKEKDISLEILFSAANYRSIAFWGLDELSLAFANELRSYSNLDVWGIYENVKRKVYNEIDYLNYGVEVYFVDTISDVIDLGPDLILVTDWTMRNIEKLDFFKEKKIHIEYIVRFFVNKFKTSAFINSEIESNYMKKVKGQGVEMLRIRVPVEADLGIPKKSPSFSVADRFKWFAREGGWKLDSPELNEFNMSRKEICKYIKKENGLVYYADFRSDNLNYINKTRIVLNTPKNYDNTIYLVGPCIVLSHYNTDKNSLGYYVQEKLMECNLKYKVVAFGLPNDADRYYWIELLKCQDFKRGDKIFLFDQTFRMKDWDLDLLDVFMDLLKKYGTDFYYDIPIHCGKEANMEIAEFLSNYIEKNSGICSEIELNENRYVQVNYEDTSPKNKAVVNLQLRKYQEFIKNNAIHHNPKIGSIVMNCNPFTAGHQYLAEYAASQVDYLYIFVVEEDKSYFKFKDRIELAKVGTSHIKNVKVLPSGKFIISSITFSEYFDKANLKGTVIDASLDLEIFAKQIAPCLDISVRFVGEEQIDPITAQYNQSMKDILPKFGIELHEIPRKEMNGRIISASWVREYLEEKNWDRIRELVPETTYRFLCENYM